MKGAVVDHPAKAEFFKTQAEVNAETIRDQAGVIKLYRAGHAAFTVALRHAEWIVNPFRDVHTGVDRPYPSLWHLFESAYGAWSEVDDKEREYLRARIEAVLMPIVRGDQPIHLRCWKCTLERSRCRCCAHRLDTDSNNERCIDCLVDDPADREVIDAR